MSGVVWVYPAEDYYIVKRRPFQYSVMVKDPVDGDISYRILQGNQIACPVWDRVVKQDRVTWAVLGSQVYDVSDLFPR